MIRALIYLILLVVLAVFFARFAENPGQLTLNWQSYQIEVSLVVYVAFFLAAVVLLFFLLSFLLGLITAPRRLRRHMRARRQMRGYQALRRGIFAVGAGDETTAARYAIEARRALKNEPLTALLEAQSAQLSGDHRTAQRVFEAMSEKPETRLLGLRGLFLEASREGEMEAARQYAARAVTLNPSVPWPVHALFDMQCRRRDWQGALETLAVARSHRHIARKTHDRRRAVLLTAQAQALEDGEMGRALDLALEAHRLAPDFVPAAVIAGRVLAGQGNSSRAARVLARTWQYTPHPDLALSYAYARPGDSPHDRLDRIRSLIVMTPDDMEARIALATAAVDARDWQQARQALEPLLENNPTARVCALMARIEAGQNRDAGRVREWLARAVRAPRDAIWMADGVVSSEWQPISPVTGQLDAFEWRVPQDQSGSVKGDPLFDEIAALSQELETVARKIGQAEGDRQPETDLDPSEPLTITVRAEEAEVAPDTSQEKPVAETAPAAETSEPKAGQPKAQTGPDEEKAATAPSAPAAAPASEPKAQQDDRPAAPTSEPAESEKPAGTKQAHGDRPAAAQAAAGQTQEDKHSQKKTGPDIFIPTRPPDDPGPEPTDYEETSTPYSRYRNH